MSPLTLFLQADIVVKLVMLGLLAASVWTWAIIFTHALRLRRINRQTDGLSSAISGRPSDIDAFHAKRGDEKLPIAAVLAAGARRMAPLDPRRAGRPRRHPRAARQPDERRRRGRARPPRRPPQHPRHGRLGRAVRRPVRHGVGHHAQLHRHRRRQQHRRSRWSRRASPRRCSPPPSACSRRSRRSSPTTG